MPAPGEHPWHQVIHWLLEWYTEPEWTDCAGLNDAFYMEDVNKGARKDKMTYQFLITRQGYNPSPSGTSNQSRFETWYRNNRDYLPEWLRNIKMGPGYLSINPKDTESQELLRKFNDWFDNMMNKVELDITQRYFLNGAKRHLDILERRFRNNWNLKCEPSIKVEKNTDTPEVIIKFGDA